MLKIIFTNINIAFAQTQAGFPDVGTAPEINLDLKFIIWKILLGVLTLLIILFIFIRKNRLKKPKPKK
ncbi:MAG: hypothetical protein WDK96_01635 [Candidatus Paceibacterota bacterium]|jgi:hypothetical protein